MHILLNFGCVPLKRCKLAALRHTSFLYAPLRQNSSRKICKAVLPCRTLQAGVFLPPAVFRGPATCRRTCTVSRRAGYLRDSRIWLRLCGGQRGAFRFEIEGRRRTEECSTKDFRCRYTCIARR